MFGEAVAPHEDNAVVDVNVNVLAVAFYVKTRSDHVHGGEACFDRPTACAAGPHVERGRAATKEHRKRSAIVHQGLKTGPALGKDVGAIAQMDRLRLHGVDDGERTPPLGGQRARRDLRWSRA